ncbi:MAG: DNA-binding transcriptional regulator GbsR (MarR family) [Cognaticolwellia sp.]|jgi:DNA-binding transcriptional regulator GbsR (MarR family)
METTTQNYDDFRRQCGESMAGIFRIYGMSEMQGHVLGALMGSAAPITLGELTTLLGAAKSTVSVAARGLETFGLVLRTRVMGDRRDHYQVQENMLTLGEHLLKRFVIPEFQAGSEMLRQMQDSLALGTGDDWPDRREGDVLKARTEALQALSEGSAVFMDSLLLPSGRLDQERIAQLIALLTQLQGKPQ